METIILRIAEIFGHYISSFPNTSAHSTFNFQQNSKKWTEIDVAINRTYSIEKVIGYDYTELEYIDFKSGFENFCNIRLEQVLSNTEPGSSAGPIFDPGLAQTNITDCTEIWFTKYYSYLIIYLKRLGFLESATRFEHTFFVLENYERIKQLITDSEPLNFYCNWIYGALPRSDAEKVRNVSRKIQSRLSSISSCLYTDVDVFFFKNGAKLSLDDYLQILGLPYKKTQVDNIIIFKKKCYIAKYADGETRIRGFPELSIQQLAKLGIK